MSGENISSEAPQVAEVSERGPSVDVPAQRVSFTEEEDSSLFSMADVGGGVDGFSNCDAERGAAVPAAATAEKEEDNPDGDMTAEDEGCFEDKETEELKREAEASSEANEQGVIEGPKLLEADDLEGVKGEYERWRAEALSSRAALELDSGDEDDEEESSTRRGNSEVYKGPSSGDAHLGLTEEATRRAIAKAHPPLASPNAGRVSFRGGF